MDSKFDKIFGILDEWQEDTRSRAVAFEPGRKPLATSRDVAKQICVLFEKPEQQDACPECGGTGAGKPTLESPDGYPCKSCKPQDADLREKIVGVIKGARYFPHSDAVDMATEILLEVKAAGYKSPERQDTDLRGRIQKLLSYPVVQEHRIWWAEKTASEIIDMLPLAGWRPLVTQAQQDQLPKLKESELDTAEEKTAWGHYSAGYLNAQQDMLRAGWHHCPKGEWPVLTDGEISRVIATAPTPCPMEFKDEPKIRALLMAQRDADRKRCPAQEGKL